ncbi:hypothetical protein PMAYCL1PPCAC_09620, partial [Pristionchus mayeri]
KLMLQPNRMHFREPHNHKSCLPVVQHRSSCRSTSHTISLDKGHSCDKILLRHLSGEAEFLQERVLCFPFSIHV